MENNQKNIPNSWATEYIGNIATTSGGKRLPLGCNYSDQPTNHPYIRVTDFENMTINSNNLKYLDEETSRKISRYTISSNDVYISIAGTIGIAGNIPKLFDGANLTENAAKITPHGSVYYKYLAYYLNSEDAQKQIIDYTISTTQPKLALNKIKKIIIPIPPLAEQRRIVEKIEEIRYAQKRLSDTIGNLISRSENLVEVILSSAFRGELSQSWRIQKRNQNDNNGEIFNNIQLPKTWQWESIGNLSIMIGSGITPKGGKSNYTDSGIAFIRSQNVQMLKLDLSDVVHITPSLNEEMKRTKVHLNDVLLNITGASIGRVAWFDLENFPSNVNQHVCIIRLKKAIHKWITYCLASKYGQEQIMDLQSGVTREGLNYSQVKQLMVPIPPDDEIDYLILKIENAINVEINVWHSLHNSFELCEKIIQSLFQQAFTGKLIPQDPTDEPASVLLERLTAEKVKVEAGKKGARQNELDLEI